MTGQLTINGKDAYTTWGVTLDASALSTLMTPPPLKPFVSNKSGAEDGKEVLGVSTQEERAFFRPRLDSREITLAINLTARSEAEFLERYNSFVAELMAGVITLSTKWQAGVVYRLIYLSATQFSQLRRSVASISLRLEEPNPRDRQP